MRAFEKMLKARTGIVGFTDAQEVFDWWLGSRKIDKDTMQLDLQIELLGGKR